MLHFFNKLHSQLCTKLLACMVSDSVRSVATIGIEIMFGLPLHSRKSVDSKNKWITVFWVASVAAVPGTFAS